MGWYIKPISPRQKLVKIHWWPTCLISLEHHWCLLAVCRYQVHFFSRTTPYHCIPNLWSGIVGGVYSIGQKSSAKKSDFPCAKKPVHLQLWWYGLLQPWHTMTQKIGRLFGARGLRRFEARLRDGIGLVQSWGDTSLKPPGDGDFLQGKGHQISTLYLPGPSRGFVSIS